MTTKLALLSFLLMVGCAPKDVKFPENPDAVTQNQITMAEKNEASLTSGSFLKQSTLNSSIITTATGRYYLSEYSSNQALTYYANKPLGSNSQVKFRGAVPVGNPRPRKINNITYNGLVIDIIQDY